ncbi:lytic transglycosylase domain-containing protein [Mangrovihabitans endophyticus]|nr:lytic transglycosylase domain-containing protein [Mangrovihabitans endophyticus]
MATAIAACGLTAAAAAPAWAGSPDVRNVPQQYEGLIRQAAVTCDAVNGPLLAAQIEQESEWDPNAVSSIGAQGIAQFLPGTWDAYGVDANGDGTASPFDPADAIITQGIYMCDLVSQVSTVPADPTTALLWAYNAGPQATRDANGQPPTAEAEQYANRIINELIPKYTP